jgi:hypothetical protein
VIILTKAKPSRVSDIKQLDEETIVQSIPEEVPIEEDLGFHGLQNEFENIYYRLP